MTDYIDIASIVRRGRATNIKANSIPVPCPDNVVYGTFDLELQEFTFMSPTGVSDREPSTVSGRASLESKNGIVFIRISYDSDLSRRLSYLFREEGYSDWIFYPDLASVDALIKEFARQRDEMKKENRGETVI